MVTDGFTGEGMGGGGTRKPSPEADTHAREYWEMPGPGGTVFFHSEGKSK